MQIAPNYCACQNETLRIVSNDIHLLHSGDRKYAVGLLVLAIVCRPRGVLQMAYREIVLRRPQADCLDMRRSQGGQCHCCVCG